MITMLKKYCYVCKLHKSVSCFGKNRSKKDGLSTECRECKRLQDKKYHRENREVHCKKMKDWRNSNLETQQEKERSYARSERGREVNNKATRKYYQIHRELCLTRTKKRNIENPEKCKARNQINNAVKLGKIDRPDYCQRCNKKRLTQSHHPDYSKPFEVTWVCRKCHGKLHRKVILC